MKKYLILTLSLFLFACNQNETPQSPGVNVSKDGIQGQTVQTVGVGDPCGGAEKTACKSGLRCKLNPNSSDESGVCEDTVVDKSIECPSTQKPVCAVREDNKNAYLNECEAKRHGAQILYEGFCKEDESIKDSCTAGVLGLEGCIKNVKGFMFDGTKCIEKVVQGCRPETPFTSLEACEKTCANQESTPQQDPSTLLQDCPEEKIINEMPTIGDTAVKEEYFIYKGERKELTDFDAQYLKQNCSIKETVVQ